MIKENLERVWEKIEKAAIKSGRNKDDITLVAVSKTFPVESIIEAIECGQRIFGENRVQEALSKIEKIKEMKIDAEFHLIGHLQTNKVRYLKDNFSLIQSVDRVEVARLINERAKKINYVQDILLQVNIAREPQKSGVLMENFDELLEFVVNCENLKLKGLMMIPPFEENPENNRIYFSKMRELFLDVKSKYDIEYLSMGMSDDFEIAIEEGSNMVRIGSAIFGKREYK
ncbi:YggS family pyridoxal phosphate-dependent enzyme [Deferribacter autotrophicus]|uniref:Pyridoxal phosphate homeostasis protein n=1 Tax=Deferribacter autotrophicus TaxID=500465 RepID=A0A5A8F780_9BACT|nr:YggS family pyridoxal phosphate-dependent enzyme [Deferribacter autotrophicus]KAA0259184.1 YggS family pyridoxal phosphate-dependent enzyme [Deferribacter autotrophicus]